MSTTQSYTLSNNFRRKKYLKYGDGGPLDPNEDSTGLDIRNKTQGVVPKQQDTKSGGDFAGKVGGIATGVSSLTDMFETNKNRVSVGGSTVKGAAAGASAGAVFGPWGAAIGGVVGGAAGLISGLINKKAEKQKISAMNQRNTIRERARMDAFISANPESYKGYENASYFELGGTMASTPLFNDYYRKKAGNTAIVDPNAVNRSVTSPIREVQPNETDPYAPVLKIENGGQLSSNYIASQYSVGGNMVQQSSDGTEAVGRSHAQGGIKLPEELGAEVEGGETTKGDYVFSDKLGFAKLHKPIMRAKGKIESKPYTPERANSIKLLNEREEKLKLSQEYLKQQLGHN